jgi:hypothetical protein
VGALAKQAFQAAHTGDRNALKFVIHLVADLHQPLHVGFEKDRGGNWFNLRRPEDMPEIHKDTVNLHVLWDHALPGWAWRVEADPDTQLRPSSARTERFPELSVEEVSEMYLAATHEGQEPWMLPSLSKGTFASEQLLHLVFAGVATEILVKYTKPLAYVNVNEAGVEQAFLGPREPVSRMYLNLRSPLIPGLVTKAAVRLAQILNLVAAVNAGGKYFESPRARRMANIQGRN